MRLRLILMVSGLAAGLYAQAGSPTFPSPTYFRKHFSTPPARVEMRPPVRLPDFVAGDALELSLRSYVELVLANNVDIEIQRVTVERDRNAIERAFGSFDPTLNASFTSTRTKTPASDALAGAATQNQLNQPADFTYRQTLDTGTQYNVGFSGSKSSSNSSFQTYNPALTARLTFGFTQPLLRNRGRSIVRLPITIARSRLKGSEHNLRDQVSRLIVQAENAYWTVVEARENLRVQEEALKLYQVFLQRNERELELGALSPLEMFQPRADVKAAELQVSQAKYRLLQAEDALRRQIGADLDPDIRKLAIRLTEPVLPPTDAAEIDREEAVEKALSLRPDLKAQIQALETDDLSIKQSANLLRPDLSLTGTYVSTGRGGTFFQRSNVFGESGQRNQVIQMTPGGFGDAMDQLFNFGFPIYSFGLTLRLPLRDRAASANLADALLTKRLDALRTRGLEQTIRQEVLNAVTQVESSKAAVQLATVNRDLNQQMLDAERKKYDLGVNTIFFVLNAQQRLVAAEAQLVSQSSQYRRNLTQLLRSTGELLEARGVAIQ